MSEPFDGSRTAEGIPVGRSSFYVLRRFWRYVHPYRSHFFLAILLLLFMVPLSQLALFLTRDVTNEALVASSKTTEERWHIVINIVILQATFTLASAMLWIMREVLEWYASMRASYDLRLAFYRHLLRLPMSFLRQRPPGEHLYRATTDFYKDWNQDGYDPGVAGFIVREIPQLIETVYSLAWGAFFLYLIDPVLMWMLLLYSIPFTVAAHFLYSKVCDAQFAMRHRAEVESAVLRDSIVGLRTVKSMGRDLFQFRKYLMAAVAMRRENIRVLFRTTLAEQGVLWLIRFLFSSGIYIYITIRVMQGHATIGDWLTTFLLLAAAQVPMEKFVQILQRMRIQMVPAKRVLETLDVEPEFEDKPNAVSLAPFHGSLEFRRVDLEYIAEHKSLENISLEIRPGEFIGFVGPSGAGKSSILTLLLRLYLPTRGELKIDGNRIEDIKLDTWLAQIGVVPQSTYLYDGTIADNVRFGNPDATDSQALTACELANVIPFAERQEDGLDTWVTEGARLSGGERQRIGIARALVRNPRLLMLDEATANLDPATEREIMRMIEDIRGNRTIIAVAHRLRAVRNCDRIVVMNEGRISAVGSHEELLVRSDLYRNMWDQQNADVEIEVNTQPEITESSNSAERDP